MIWVICSLFLEPLWVDTDILAEEVSSEDVGLLFTIAGDGLSSKGLCWFNEISDILRRGVSDTCWIIDN